MSGSRLVAYGVVQFTLLACGARSPYSDSDEPNCALSSTAARNSGGERSLMGGGAGRNGSALVGTTGSLGGDYQSVAMAGAAARGVTIGGFAGTANAGGVAGVWTGAGGGGGIAVPRGGVGGTSRSTAANGGAVVGGNFNGSSAAANGGLANSVNLGGTFGNSSDGSNANGTSLAAVGNSTSISIAGTTSNPSDGGNGTHGGAPASDGGAANGSNFGGSGDSANAGGSSGSPSGGGAAGASPDGAGPWPGCVCGQPNCGDCPATPMVDRGRYSIDATETTNAEYGQFIDANVSMAAQPAVCGWNLTYVPNVSWPVVGKDDLPVTWVDWCDAYAYCAWAGKRLCGAIGGGATPYNSVKDPSVSQWFAACTDDGASTYPYGLSYDGSTCNGAEHGIATVGEPTLLVAGSLSACITGQGIHDMSGNAFEWEDSCSDWTGEDDICRVRGGSFFSDIPSVLACTSASSLYLRNTVRSSIGFRCCRDN